MAHSFRVLVGALADRSALVVDLPTVVRLLICRMRLWSLLETPVEPKRARLTRTIVESTNWSGALVSFALRLPQFVRRSEEDPSLYRDFVGHFERARGRRCFFILEELHLEDHPYVTDSLYGEMRKQ